MILVKLSCDGPNCGKTTDGQLAGGKLVKALVATWTVSQAWHYCSQSCHEAHKATRKRP